MYIYTIHALLDDAHVLLNVEYLYNYYCSYLLFMAPL